MGCLVSFPGQWSVQFDRVLGQAGTRLWFAEDGIHDAGDQVAAVGAVAVHERDHVAVRAGCLGPFEAGAAVAAAAVDDGGAGGLGSVRGAVRAAAVGDDDLADVLGENFLDDWSDAVGFVPGGDDDGDLA